jgi:magnesium-transporting ATPase (P-type)
MTIIFNTFVLYSLFNQINCRVLDDSFNIFKRIFSNWLFLAVTGIEMICQVLIVQYGGLVFKCSKGGLTASQWTWCLCFAGITFVVSFVMKIFSLENLCEKKKKKNYFNRYNKNKNDLEKHLFDDDEDDIERAVKKIEMKENKESSLKNLESN